MLERYFIVDKENKPPYEETYYETTYWHDIGNGISWRRYKHASDGHLAGEGITSVYGDKSYCVHDINGIDWTTRPVVVEARHYKKEGKPLISAVFSYPYGIGYETQYFWELFTYGELGVGEDEIERFIGQDAEKEMEERIKELLA